MKVTVDGNDGATGAYLGAASKFGGLSGKLDLAYELRRGLGPRAGHHRPNAPGAGAPGGMVIVQPRTRRPATVVARFLSRYTPPIAWRKQ